MKKLYLLIPVAFWIADYFVWNIAGRFIEPYPTGAGIWWVFTCILMAVATVISAVWACSKAFD